MELDAKICAFPDSLSTIDEVGITLSRNFGMHDAISPSSVIPKANNRSVCEA